MENLRLLSFEGILKRKWFIVYNYLVPSVITLTLLMLGALYIIIIHNIAKLEDMKDLNITLILDKDPVFAILMTLGVFVCAVFTLILSLSAITRRIRDINGKCFWYHTFIFVITSSIPFVGFLAGLWITFWPSLDIKNTES